MSLTFLRGRWRQWINLAIVVAGLIVLVLGFSVGRGPVTCRGVEMRPGDVCHKSSFTDLKSTQTQTYEQRVASAKASRPTVIGLGVALTGFGTLLLWQARRAPKAAAAHSGSSDIGP